MAPGPSRQAALERQPDDSPATHVGREIETRLGGVFFLLDLALYLDLYGDFSRPRQPGIGLDPWDFLVLLGGELGVREELATDALGDLLRELSGRADGSRPGDGWDPGADWRMPPEWLTPFEVGTEPWRWSAAHQRLRVDHPAGFRVVDIALDGRPTAARARRALRRLPSRPQIRRGSLALVPTAGRRGVDRWIALLGLYARSRLRLALGAAAPAELAPTLLRLPARVTTTALEVDVEFDLASLPISVRIAGLDRDPGWIPAARRTVTYHFR